MQCKIKVLKTADSEDAVIGSGKLNNLSPQDCINELIKEMAKTAKVMEDPSMKIFLARVEAVVIAWARQEEGKDAMGLTQVSIHFERIKSLLAFSSLKCF